MATGKSKRISPFFKDLTDQTFNRWTVIRRLENTQRGQAVWLCRCECGALGKVTTESLVSNNSKSCGCWRRDHRIRQNLTHGMSNTAEHETWKRMIARCERPGASQYEYYGGRGIRVCDEWRNSFQTFFDYMGKRPSKNHSIDRIDTNGNYEPGNVRWATKTEQSRNTRQNHVVEYQGKRMCLAEACELAGTSCSLVIGRLRRGWTVDDALNRPKVHVGKKLCAADAERIRDAAKSMKRTEVAKLFGVHLRTVESIVLGETWKTTGAPP